MQDYVSVSKGVHNQKLCNIQKSLQLDWIIYCFQIKTLKCKYWVLTFLCLETQMMCSDWLKNDSFCLRCSAHQNVVLLVDAMDWDLTYKFWSRRSFTALRATNASCIGVNPALALQLYNNFLTRNSKNMKMMRNLITISGTIRIEQYWQPLQPLTKNTKRFWLM